MSAEQSYINIRGARVNNLKNISLKIPRNRFISISGVSGSGKSSLAFDTLYSEGQRRYVESLSAYARQFLGRMKKPECDFITGLPPAIAIEQKVISRNPRSTVGTTTEIYDYLRLLYARIGKTYSPISGEEVKKHSVEDVLKAVEEFSEGTKYLILAPLQIAADRSVLQQLRMSNQEGYTRLFVDGEVVRIDDYMAELEERSPQEHEPAPPHAQEGAESPLYLVIDRLGVSPEKDVVNRLYDSAETAFYEGNGKMRLVFLPSKIAYDFSTTFEADGIRFEEPNENMFSFNSPAGACPTCEGFGNVIGIDERLVISNTALSVHEGCVQCWHGEKLKIWNDEFCRRAAAVDFPIFEPYYKLSKAQKDWLWHGLPSESKQDIHDRICIDSFFQMVKENQYKIQYRVLMSRYRGKTVCPDCHGAKLKKEALWVKVNGMSIADLVQMPVSNLRQWFRSLRLEPGDAEIAKRLLAEINSRLEFLADVGLGYLTLNRQSSTLSGGESQRINLTTSLGSSLVGSLYILDEPSIGLHSRDTDRLIQVLKKLRDIGNTVIVVEHDEEILRASDYLIDIGPNAGRLGGEVVYAGRFPTDKEAQDMLPAQHPESYTVQYLTGALRIAMPSSRRAWNNSIMLQGCRMNNLKGIDFQLPLNVMTVITGVSGSGKSSLVKGILHPAMKRHFDEVCDAPGEFVALKGDVNLIKHVEFVDQNLIGKSTRSNPATYVKAYDLIRQLFAEQPLAKQLGFTAQYFSFNAEGGRCEECKGAGVINVEMQFMADLVLTCEACHGQRFKRDVLDVRFKDRNIHDILEMTIDEAVDFFRTNNQKAIVNKLKPLQDVGLGYIKMGQNSSTLSGGENQRVKLAYFIGQERQEPTLFIFDEPTTGLHFHDINKLMAAFNTLITHGHTILIVEHNMDVIKCADWIVDLGPEGGDKGGNLVFAGRPEELIECPESITGKFLKAKF